jgi:hypothetical protein
MTANIIVCPTSPMSCGPSLKARGSTGLDLSGGNVSPLLVVLRQMTRRENVEWSRRESGNFRANDGNRSLGYLSKLNLVG